MNVIDRALERIFDAFWKLVDDYIDIEKEKLKRI